MARRSLTHLDARNRPAMVDVGAKDVTRRRAVAEARLRLPPAVSRALKASGHRTRKGPVFDTAIVAGVMAAKRTHELIPFCHPLGLEDCRVRITQRGGEIHIRCETAVHHRTGVEMEALTGATVAALTTQPSRRLTVRRPPDLASSRTFTISMSCDSALHMS